MLAALVVLGDEFDTLPLASVLKSIGFDANRDEDCSTAERALR